MKTNLFLLGMAVAAFSSCTNEEVTDVAQNRAIKFNQFVENNTREVQEVESLSSFYVKFLTHILLRFSIMSRRILLIIG